MYLYTFKCYYGHKCAVEHAEIDSFAQIRISACHCFARAHTAGSSFNHKTCQVNMASDYITDEDAIFVNNNELTSVSII